MAKHLKGINKYQKAARRPGERRVRGEEIDQFLELSRSDEPREREIAANNLCPCHVRRRIDAVWQALYRMLEDSDVRVRRAAWHTLEDGGCPDDPALDAIFERVSRNETDRQIRGFIKLVGAPRREREAMAIKLAGRSPFIQRGKCDFCASLNVRVISEYDTSIPIDHGTRAALICESCDQARQNSPAAT